MKKKHQYSKKYPQENTDWPIIHLSEKFRETRVLLKI